MAKFTEQEKAVFDFYFYSMEIVAFLGFLRVLFGVNPKYESLKPEVLNKTKALLGLREKAGSKIKGFYPSALLADEAALILLEPDALAGKMQEETQVLQEAVTKDPDMPIFGILGSILGVLAGSLYYADKDDKKPYVEGVSQAIASSSNLIPEDLRKTMADLAEFEGQKITPQNKEQIEKLINTIKEKF